MRSMSLQSLSCLTLWSLVSDDVVCEAQLL